MNKKTLLKELDRLSHRERTVRVVQLARKEASNPKLVELMDSLVDSCYEWRLQLRMALAVGDIKRVLSGFKHPRFEVRRYAASRAPELKGLDGERLVEELHLLDQHSRRVLLRKIRQRNRSDLADSLMPVLLEKFGPREAAFVLAAAGPTVVQERLPELAHEIVSWTTLTGRHPDIVLDYLKRTLSVLSTRAKARRWRCLNGALRPLVKKRAEKLIELALETATAELYPDNFGGHWRELTRRFPSLVTGLLKHEDVRKLLPRRGLPPGLVEAFRHLNLSDQIWISQSQSDHSHLVARLLEALPPSQRGEIFEAAFQSRDNSQSIWPGELMMALPHAIRKVEAERMLQLRFVQEQPSQKVQKQGYLPPEQARVALLPEAKSPQAEERAAALGSIVLSTYYYRSGMSETLELLRRLKNEQDPVRLAVLSELAKIPGTRFEDQHFEALELLVDAVLTARDSSSGTLNALSRSLIKILSTSPIHGTCFDFAARMLEKLGWRRFQLQTHQLSNFEPERCRAVIRRLMPLVKEATKRDDYNLLFCLAACEPAQEMPEIQEQLEKLASSKPEWTARRAIMHWLECAKTRNQRVERLLKKDSSSIVLWQVLRHVEHHRQDLLDPFLVGKAVKGKFLDGKTIYVLPTCYGFDKWLPRQQEAFAKLLLKVAKDPKQALSARANAISRLGTLSDTGQNLVEPFLDSPEQALREAALGTLGIPPLRLLDFLDRDEARVAVFALGAIVQRLAPSLHSPFFKKALSVPLKVTSHKELVRLLGRCRGPHSLPMLESEWKKESLHRDVRIAVLHGIRQMLDSAVAWQMLKEALQLAEPHIGRALLTQRPQELHPHHRERYLELIVSLRNAEDRQLRQEFWNDLHAWSDQGSGLIAELSAACISDLDRADWTGAANLLIACCRDGEQTSVLFDAAKSLSTQCFSGPEAEPERDRPALQRLHKLASQLLALPSHCRRYLVALFNEMSPLYQQPDFSYKLRLAANVPAQELAEQCDGTYERVRALLSAFRSELSYRAEEAHALLEQAQVYAEQSSPFSRLLALECLIDAGPRLGWNEASRNLLVKLRKDGDENVALAAGRVFVIGEG